MYSSSSMYLVALGLGAVILTKLFTIGRRPKNLPPGPPTIPILGNIHLMPKRAPHLQFQKWAEEYGPIYSLILGTKTVIVLSSDLAVRELHDKRSAIYSGRPSMYVGQDLASGGLRFGLMDYGSTWRMIRRMMHNILNIVAAKSYVPYQDLENKNMLVGFLDEPNEFYNHIRRYANSLTTQMVFGFRTISINDPKLQQLFRNFHNFSEVAGSGVAVLIDLFPVLRLLPDFLLPMRKYCKKLHASELNLYMGHWLNVKKAIKAGTAKPCFCVDLVKAQDAERLSEDQAAYISGTFLEAGSDTTASELIAFVQALVLYPNVQKVAQEELDRVIGPNRLPTMEDEMNLQYIRGCIKETLRWMPTVILSIPHAVIKDDWYEGYLIPKGATVIHNTWTMHRDPARYVNPEVFDPSRYANDFQSAREAATNPDVSQRDHYAFGTGRRICVGMHIAERSLFLAMSRILWGFNVEPATDENGKEILPDPGNLTQGVVVCPQPFPAKITPRSEKHAALMREQWDECLGLLDKDLQWKEMPKGMKLSTYDATNNKL